MVCQNGHCGSPRPGLQCYLTYERKLAGPHLVVVPLSVLPNWMAEFRRFAPDMRTVRIHVNDEGDCTPEGCRVEGCRLSN